MLELVTGTVIALVVLALILEPLLRPHVAGVSAWAAAGDEGDFVELEELESPKVQALLALREIEFDRATGKLSETDYAQLKQQYSTSALKAIEAEEALGTSQAPTPVGDGDEAEALIQRAKAHRPTDCPTCSHPLVSGSLFCSNCGRSLAVADASPRCWVCGEDLVAGAKFCNACGAEAGVVSTSG
jgi:hypothetical protein